MTSPELVKNLRSQSAKAVARDIVEIRHPLITDAIRIVDDNADLQALGHTWYASNLRYIKPAQTDRMRTFGTLAVRTVDQLAAFIRASRGGKDAEVYVRRVLPPDYDSVQYEAKFVVVGCVVTPQAVEVKLGARDTVGVPAVSLVHSPQVSPGLY